MLSREGCSECDLMNAPIKFPLVEIVSYFTPRVFLKLMKVQALGKSTVILTAWG